MMKNLSWQQKRRTTLLSLGLALAAPHAAAQQAETPSAAPITNPNRPPEWDALYAERFAALMRDRGIMQHYDPMEAIVGTAHYRPLPLARPSQRSIRDDALEAAAAYAERSNARAFLVWRDGRLQSARYFKGNQADTPIVSKSLSKPLTAIAIGRAIALGNIQSVDQAVSDFIPEWRGTPKAAITIRHLLDMRSGLLEQIYSDDPDHPINRAYIDPDHGWHIVHNYPLTHQPGSHYGYGNATSELVALVIERATGRRYADFIGAEILAPIGAQGGRIWLNRQGGLAHSGCCMEMPAESWLRLALLLLDDGMADGKPLLPKDFVADMARGTPQNPYYGMGLWLAGPYTERRGFGGPHRAGPRVLHSQPYPDKDLFLFDGNSNQVIYISRAARTVIVRLGDTPAAEPEWDNSRLPNMLFSGMIWKKGQQRPAPQPIP